MRFAMLVGATVWITRVSAITPPTEAGQTSPASLPSAIIGATLIDGNGGKPVLNSVIVISGDHVVAVGARGSISIPRGSKIIDASGRWIIPGMIDAHVHFHETGRIYTAPGALDLTATVSYEDEIRWMKQRVPQMLTRYLCAGVTSAISVGGPHFEYEVRESALRLAKAPNVFVGHGPIIAVALSHDIFPSIDGDEATRFVANPSDARLEVKRGASWGADLIKAGYLGAAFTARLEAGHPERAAADGESRYFEILPALVSEAHAHGLPVTIHVTELDAAKKSLLAGVDSLAHTVTDREVDQEFLQLAAARHVTIVTTLAPWMRQVQARTGHVPLTPMETRCGDPEVISSWSEVKNLPPAPSSMIESAASRQRTAMINVKKIHDFGIPLALGVDAGNLGLLHGASVHKEIELLREAGIPPMDIIVSATRNAAKIAGKEDIVGTIAPGKLADLIILDRNPLTDIRNVGSIESVMKSGRLYPEVDLLP
jgi:imidazolonepropionase-like amidohydrolase